MGILRRSLVFRRRFAGNCSCFLGSRFCSRNSDDIRREFEKKFDDLRATSKYENFDKVPAHSDVVIIGGGAVGLGVAHWLKSISPLGYAVTVVERDPTYSKASSIFPMSGLRMQYGQKELIEMSKFSASFFRDIKEHLSLPDLPPPNIFYNHEGFLILATKKDAPLLEESFEIQRSCHVKVELLWKKSLSERFPWLNTSDVELATYGMQDEGWFDPGFLLAAYKMKCSENGVKFLTGELVGFQTESLVATSVITGKAEKRKKLKKVDVKTPDGKVGSMEFAVCIDCAGMWASNVAKLAGIGSSQDGPLSVELPIEPRQRVVYTIYCPDGPGLETPIVLDTSGVFVRREGLRGHYVCGINLPKDCTEDSKAFFESVVKPALSHRIPAFQKSEVTQIDEGRYDHNYFDGAPLIGNHPTFKNFFMASGFGGEGPQLSPAIGRALMEFIIKGDFESLDLSKMFIDRVYSGEKLVDLTSFRLC